MKINFAREYLYLLACLVVCVITYLSLFLWNKYWGSKFQKVDNIVPWSYSDIPLNEGYFLYEVRLECDIPFEKRTEINSNLEYYKFDPKTSYYEVPFFEETDFQKEIIYAQKVGWKPNSDLTVHKIALFVFMTSGGILFLFRYFIYSLRWVFRRQKLR